MWTVIALLVVLAVGVAVIVGRKRKHESAPGYAPVAAPPTVPPPAAAGGNAEQHVEQR